MEAKHVRRALAVALMGVVSVTAAQAADLSISQFRVRGPSGGNDEFVELFNGAYAMGEGIGNWDGHRLLKSQYEIHAPILDQPAAALLKDLKQRGLLEDTLVVWTTEFGRMPTFQVGANGRDHNPKGFTVWLAGAGVKRATSYGETDEFGYQAAVNPSSVYELHATILHLLGLDHERLSFSHNGAEQRLTFVHGRVINDVLA